MKWNSSKHMQTIRLHAVDILLFELVYPRKGRARRATSTASNIVDYCMRKNFNYGWNACAAFCQSFPDGERLEASIVGGLRVKV